MRHWLLPCLGLFVTLLTAQEFKLGSKVQNFSLTDADGKLRSFQELKGNATVVIFISARCPVSNSYTDRMDRIYRDYTSRGVSFLFVNANASEPAAEVALHAKRQGFAFPVYRDVGNLVADQFGASATPESFVIDHAGVVRYHGAIDDAQNEARVKTKFLRDALDALLRGSEIQKQETRSFGCTIKRVRKAS